MSDWVVYWTNPATKRRSFAVVVDASYHWEPEVNGGLAAATRFPDKGAASAFRRRCSRSMQKAIGVSRVEDL